MGRRGEKGGRDRGKRERKGGQRRGRKRNGQRWRGRGREREREYLTTKVTLFAGFKTRNFLSRFSQSVDM